MARADTRKLDLREAENIGHGAQIVELLWMHMAIGLGDVEERIDHVFKDSRLVLIDTRHLPRISLEASHVLLRDLVNPLNIAGLAGRDFKYLLKGADFGLADFTVSLRHLGGQRDQGDREHDLAILQRPVNDHMASNRAQKRTQGPADGKSHAGACNFTPDR